MTIIDINHLLNGPDKENIYQDDEGVIWYKFSCSYPYGDKEYSFGIWARDQDDADKRMDVIRAMAKVDGMILSEVEE